MWPLARGHVIRVCVYYIHVLIGLAFEYLLNMFTSEIFSRLQVDCWHQSSKQFIGAKYPDLVLHIPEQLYIELYRNRSCSKLHV